MALPLKTGADLYNQQLIRARLQNLGAQPNTADVGLGQVYFNTGTNTAASLRIGYCYETGSVPKFHHVANLEDVNRLEELIKALSGSSSESVASVLGRVITLEGYFSNGKAKDADLLDGHNSDYFATATTVNDLLEDYEAFKAVFSDNSDDYINTWTEVKAFLDGIKNTEDLNAILLGINTELGKKADKATTLAGYGITDAVLKQDYINLNDLTTTHAQVMGYCNPDGGWKTYSSGILSKVHDSGFALQGLTNALFFRGISGSVWEDNWHEVLHTGNYASVLDTRYLQLTGGIVANTSNAPLKIKTDSESTWVGIEYLNNLGEREGSIGVYGGKPIFVPAALDKIWTILHSGNYSDLITDLNNNLNVPSITIGGIKLSVVEGQLQIEGDAYATGQLSSGGIGGEGSGSGASGIVILEDWEKYDDTLAQVLGAGLGVGLRDKIAALESKATNVSVAQTLTSGKEIGAITIDGVATKLFAPDDYISTRGGTITTDSSWAFNIRRGTDSASYISFSNINETLGYLGISTDYTPRYMNAAGVSYKLLHAGDYASVLDNAYLKLTGGMINTGDIAGLTIYRNNSKYSMIHFCNNVEGALVDVGYLGVVGEGVPVYLNSGGNQFNLLHSGNFYTYAPTLTGTGASGTWGINISKSARYLSQEYLEDLEGTDDLKTSPITGKGLFVGVTGASAFGDVDAYSTSLFIGYGDYSRVGRFIFRRSDNSDILYWQTANAGATAWGTKRRIAFVDSDITGNAASATKLANNHAYTAWGQPFFADGVPQEIGYAKDIKIGANNGAAWIMSDGAEVSNIVTGATGNFLLGNGGAKKGYNTFLDGNYVYLRYGTQHETGLLLNESGNVGIGTTSPQVKLHVNGDTQVNGKLLGYYNNVLTYGLFANGPKSVYLQGANGGTLSICGTNASELDSVVLKSTYVRPNDTDTSTLGTNAARWLNVFSVYGNISSRLLVGGATDDNLTALQVQGAAYIIGGDYASVGGEAVYWGIDKKYMLGSNSATDFYLWSTSTTAALKLGTNNVERIRITADGMVGIGTNNPTHPLHVRGTTMLDGVLYNNAYNALGNVAVASFVINKGGSYFGIGPSATNVSNISFGLTSDYFGTWKSELITIRDNGGVGIGTATPQEKLHVVGNLYVTGNIIADGQVSSGGVAEAGTGGATGGSGLDRLVFEIPANTTSFPCEHGLGTREISVTIYEEGNDYQQVLADVYLDSTNVARIVFGSATDVVHKVVIIG